jgi:hypothetical protein
MSVLSLVIGVALFFLIRKLETAGPGSMLVNVLFEEAAKIVLFGTAPFAARTRIWKSLVSAGTEDREAPRRTALLASMLCIAVFGITENVLYFLSFPTSSIYRRLLYSYPIHLNTAFFYALAFLSGNPLRVALYLLLGVLYHLGLNRLSLDLPVAWIYLVGVGNIVVLLLLYWRVRLKIVQRSIR